MPGLEKQTVTWPLTGGLATKHAPLIQVPGTHLRLENVRQERLHEWKPRNGTSRSASDDVPSQVPVRAVGLPGGGVVTLSRETSGGAAFVYSPSMAARWTSPTRSGVAYPAVWTRKQVGAHSARPNKVTVATAGAGKLTLVAWENSVATGYGIEVFLLSPEGEIRLNLHLGAAGSIRPCAVYNATADKLVLVWVDGTAVKVIVFNPASGTVFSGPGNIDATAANATPYIDMVYYGNPGFTVTVVYRTGTNQIRFIEYDPSTGTATTAVTIASACDNCLCLLPDPEASAIRYVALSDNAPSVVVKRVNTAGTVQTTDTADTVKAGNICGVGYQAGAGWMIAYTTYTDTLNSGAFHFTVTATKATKKRTGVIATPVQIASDGYQLDSGAWRESGSDQMRFIIGLHVNRDPIFELINNVPQDAQHTYYEKALEFDSSGSVVLNSFDEHQARLVPLAAADYPDLSMAARLSQVQRTGTDTYLLALPRLSRFGLQGKPPTAASQYAIDVWTATYMNQANLHTFNLGPGLTSAQVAYLPAGNLIQSASGNVNAHGASALPRAPSLVPSVGGGSLTTPGTYGYMCTVEMPDEYGNIWPAGQSITSTVALTGGQNQVTLTAYFPDLESSGRLRTVKIWRTAVNGSVFRLIFAKTDTVANTMTVSFVEGLADNTVTFAAADIFNSGEVPTTLTPRFIHVEYWNGRIWGVDGDFPTRLWFSKKVIPGRAPEFVATQVIVIDDDEGDFTALDVLNDKLCAFKAGAVYAIMGDGPDSTGAGQFPTWVRLDTDVGATRGTPTVSTGDDIYFVATRNPFAIYRVNNSLQVDFVGEPIDKYLSQPLVLTPDSIIGGVFSSTMNEVRFMGAAGNRYVYDRLHGVWIVDTMGMSQTKLTLLMGNTQAMFLSNNHFVFESGTGVMTDDGSFYAPLIRSAWFRAAGFDSWLRLYRIRLLGIRTDISSPPFTTPILNVYMDNSEAVVNSAVPVTSFQVTPWRGEFRAKRQTCSTFSLEVVLVTGDETTRLEAWGVIVGVKKGTQPLTTNERWV